MGWEPWGWEPWCRKTPPQLRAVIPRSGDPHLSNSTSMVSLLYLWGRSRAVFDLKPPPSTGSTLLLQHPCTTPLHSPPDPAPPGVTPCSGPWRILGEGEGDADLVVPDGVEHPQVLAHAHEAFRGELVKEALPEGGCLWEQGCRDGAMAQAHGREMPSPLLTLSSDFWVSGSCSCPAASMHWLTASGSSCWSLISRRYSSAFWLSFCRERELWEPAGTPGAPLPIAVGLGHPPVPAVPRTPSAPPAAEPPAPWRRS